MFERMLMRQLRQWRKRDRRKPLVLRGARQVGKTTVVSEFGKEFDTFIHLNLEREADARVFSLTDDVHEVLQYVMLHKHCCSEGETLLFIDEIQNEPKAVAMLRYFYEDMPELYVIAAGSRLQSLLMQRVSFPVGRVEYLSLRPCSFLEYLNAMNYPAYAEMVERLEVKSLYHDGLMSHFNQYALVGGMPEAVASYVRHHDLQMLSPIYRSLLGGYNEDVEKYAHNDAQVKVIRHILRSGWNMAGQSIQFVNFGGSSYSSREVHEAFDTMQRAFLLSLDYPVTAVQAPFIPSLRRAPKLIWVDAGLVNFSCDIQLQFLQNKDLLDTWRGHAAEQIVAQELRVVLDSHYRDEQYFWVRDKKGTTAELDFVWLQGERIVPIEVKSGTNAHLCSLQSFMNLSEQTELAVRVWSGPFSVAELKAPSGRPFRLINIPFYYVCVLDKVLERWG